MNDQKHPLTAYPEDEKIDYLSLVASIAAADGKITDDEISTLREFCDTIGIGEAGTGLIIAALEDPSMVDVQAILERLSHTDLKFTLLTDMLFMAHADGIVSPGEEEEISKIAAKLQIAKEQISAIERYVNAVLTAQQSSQADWKLKGSEIAGVLASTGVPLGAVAISGSFLSVQGIAAGLTALGLGLGLIPGIGVALSLGVGSYFGVRWLFKKIAGKEQER